MKTPKPITYAELMAEVDKIKGSSYTKKLTDEQIKFLHKCRTSKPPLSWKQIKTLWNKMPNWRPYASGESMRTICEKYVNSL